MRTKPEILLDDRETKLSETPMDRKQYKRTELILEVLLDIRDLLTTPEINVSMEKVKK